MGNYDEHSQGVYMLFTESTPTEFYDRLTDRLQSQDAKVDLDEKSWKINIIIQEKLDDALNQDE